MKAESKLAVEITEQKSISIVYFSGIFGPLSITLLKEMVNALIRNKRYKLILKFNSLSSIDENAYDFLECAHKEVSKQDGAVVLICPPGEHLCICNELKQRYHFLIFQDFEQAREYFISREF
ncbi:MAG: STAS domain-containing protein [Rubrobacteridae bacterium]|nr:STAS domain-containing protein [Rubrobacteridae bacterium]